MNIKGAIFDCDGTLVDSLGFWEIYYQKVGKELCRGKDFIPAPEDDKAMRTQNVYFLAKIMHGKYGFLDSEEAIINWTLDIFEWYYKEIVELKSGVREFLEHLKKRGVKMCIASAAEKRFIELVLGKHDVLKYFDGIVSCTQVGAGKDKPDVFIAARDFLCTPHDQTWIFEDSLLAIETSKKAGFNVVGVYDRCSFGQDKARAISDEYIDDGGSFTELIDKIS